MEIWTEALKHNCALLVIVAVSEWRGCSAELCLHVLTTLPLSSTLHGEGYCTPTLDAGFSTLNHKGMYMYIVYVDEKKYRSCALACPQFLFFFTSAFPHTRSHYGHSHKRTIHFWLLQVHCMCRAGALSNSIFGHMHFQKVQRRQECYHSVDHCETVRHHQMVQRMKAARELFCLMKVKVANSQCYSATIMHIFSSIVKVITVKLPSHRWWPATGIHVYM